MGRRAGWCSRGRSAGGGARQSQRDLVSTKAQRGIHDARERFQVHVRAAVDLYHFYLSRLAIDDERAALLLGLRERESGNNQEHEQDQPATPQCFSHTSAPTPA